MEELQRFLNLRKFHSEVVSVIFEILEKFWNKKTKICEFNEIINGTEISGTKLRRNTSFAPGHLRRDSCAANKFLFKPKCCDANVMVRH